MKIGCFGICAGILKRLVIDRIQGAVMRDFWLKFQILLEGVLLWLGEIGLWFVRMVCLYVPIESRFGEIVFYAILAIFGIVSAIWILVERRKDLNERISTGNYIFLNLLSFLAVGIWTILYIFSFD